MSESTTASAPPRGKKILGMSQGQLLIVLSVALAGGAYLLWRSRKAKQQAQQQALSSCPDGSAPDANGNCVQSGQDWSGAIATLQTEIADLQGAAAGAGGAGAAGSAGGSGGGGWTSTPSAPPSAPPSTPPASTGAPASGYLPAGAISNLQQTGRTATSISIRWNAAHNVRQGYRYVLSGIPGGKTVKSGNTGGTSVHLTGLKPRTTYNFGIQALPGGPGNNIHVSTS